MRRIMHISSLAAGIASTVALATPLPAQSNGLTGNWAVEAQFYFRITEGVGTVGMGKRGAATDVWTSQRVDTSSPEYETSVPSHGVVMLRVAR